MTASSDTSFLFTAITCDEGGGADEEKHDEREGCTVVPHRIVDVLLDGGTEELDVVHRQQFGDSEGRDGWHEYHQDATCYARHGEGHASCAIPFREPDIQSWPCFPESLK